MNELIVRYYHSNDPSCQVCYRSGSRTQETGKFPFTFSLSERERGHLQWYLEEYLTFPYDVFQDRAKRVEELIADRGEELFAVIFRNKSDRDQSALRFYDRAMENPADCHIIILANHAAGWSLPWEFMYDPAYGYLAQKTSGFVRSHPGAAVHLNPIRRDIPRINILMIISRPGGPKDVAFQSVARPLMEIFRPRLDRIQIDVLRPPTYEQLQKVLADKPNFYHILHFDGHGVFPHPRNIDHLTFFSEQGSPGQLVFEGTGGGKHFVSGAEIRDLLKGKGVPVVMLNACQSGMTHPDMLYRSIGGELIQTGALGVVAMAYSVYVHTAAKFMAQVYESLINGQTLARAVTVAREALAIQPERESPIGPISLQDWVVPVLFQSGDVQLFEPSAIKVHLDADLIKDKQASAGTEIDLPEQPDYGFIGRDADIWKLEKALEQETIVLLQAMAGVGKTTAAVGFARWWAETGALDGPIFFFSFESYTTLDHVCNQIGGLFRDMIKAQLGIEWHILDPSQRRQLTKDILRKMPCLMIWDNFDPVAGFPKGTLSAWKQEEQQELKDFLRALRGGATKVIITSRRDEKWLGRCYRPITLQGLNQRDQTELAGRVLSRAGIDRQRLKPYGKLLNYLQGNPLAIQVILPELARIEPDDLLSALQTGVANLPRDDSEQRKANSLTASLEYRLDRLSTLLRGRLGVLGMFQGFVNVNVLTYICDDDSAPALLKGLDSNAWERMLDQSAEIGLLHKLGPGLYKIHPALPWFFHQILQTTYTEDMEWLEQRFVDECGDLSQSLQQQLTTDAEAAMTIMKLEEQNLRYAIRLGLRYGMWDALNRILMGIAHTLSWQSRWSESELLNLDIEEKATDGRGVPLAGAEDLCGLLWHNLGMAAQVRRQSDEAEKWYHKSLAMSKELRNEHRQAATSHQLGMIAEERRQFDEAEKWYRRSLAMWENLKDEHGQASTLNQLGIIAQERWQFDEAEKCYRKSLAIEEKLGDEYSWARTSHQLGRIAQERGQFDEAEKWYRGSLAISEKMKDEHPRASALHQLGIIAQGRGQFDEAEDSYRKSLAIWEKLKDEDGRANTLHQLGRIAQGRGQFDEAEKWCRKSLEIRKQLKDEHGRATALHQLGIIAQERGQFDEAEKWYHKSLEIREQLKDEHGRASTLHELGIIAQQRGQFDEAEKSYHKSLEIREQLKDEHGQASTLHQLGIIAQERGQFDEAERLYLWAEGIFRKYGNEYFLSLVRSSLRKLHQTCA